MDIDACRAGRPAKKESSAFESSLVRKEMNDCLRDVLAELPAGQRDVLVLSLLEDLTNSEIADRLKISLETVKIRLHRGRSALKKKLGKRCGWFRDSRNRLNWDGNIL